MSEGGKVRIVKKSKNTLPICLRYGYVIGYGLAKRFKILERKRYAKDKKAHISHDK